MRRRDNENEELWRGEALEARDLELKGQDSHPGARTGGAPRRRLRRPRSSAVETMRPDGARPPLAAVVFDMDGTLIESSRVLPAAYIAAVEAAGGPTLSPQTVVDAYSVGPPSAMLTHLLGRPSSLEEVDDYHDRLRAAAHDVAPYAGVRETLEALRGRVGVAVYTGASSRAARILLAASDLLPYFDVVIGGDDVARPKPAPDGIELACERLGVLTSAAAYIGDAPNDLEAARRSGAMAVAAAWGHQYRPGEHADGVLDEPHDVLALIGADD
jgi:HAD superfamily hydrolase (TIGR01509 family)